MESAKLTDRQRRFVEEYCGEARLNATQAAIRAGYSAATAASQGSRLLRNVNIRAAIDAILDELSMSSGEALRRLTEWGEGSLAPFLRITGSGEVAVDLSTAEAQRSLHLIRELEVIAPKQDDDGNEVVSGRVRIKLHDAKDAVVQLAKIRGLFVERHEHSGPEGGPIEHRIEDSRERLARELAATHNRITGTISAGTTNGTNGAHG